MQKRGIFFIICDRQLPIEDLKILLDVDISSGKSGSSGTLHLENPIAIILYMA